MNIANVFVIGVIQLPAVFGSVLVVSVIAVCGMMKHVPPLMGICHVHVEKNQK
jgi:hypothetical protein